MLKFFLDLLCIFRYLIFNTAFNELAFLISTLNYTLFPFKPRNGCGKVCTDQIQLAIFKDLKAVADILIVAYLLEVLFRYGVDRFGTGELLFF